MRANLRLINGGLSFQPGTKLPHAPAPKIVAGITIRGEYIRLSPVLRQRLAAMATESQTRKPGGAA